jgi:hypothetical protein
LSALHYSVVFASSRELSRQFDSCKLSWLSGDRTQELDGAEHASWDVNQVPDLDVIGARHPESIERVGRGSFS